MLLLTGTFVRESVGCTIWFGVYEQSISQLLKYRCKESKNDLRPIEVALCGGIAGFHDHT